MDKYGQVLGLADDPAPAASQSTQVSLRQQAALSPQEQQHETAYETSTPNLDSLRQAIVAEKRPDAKAALQADYDKLTRARAASPKSDPYAQALGITDGEPSQSAPQAPAPSAPAAPSESKVSRFLHGAAGAADLVAGVPGQIVHGADYAVRRAFGQSPKDASAAADHGAGEWLSHPVGDFFGVTNTPGYQQEGGHRIMDFVAQNLDKGADWIAAKTGLPKSDVSNMIQSATIAGPKVARAVSKAGGVALDGAGRVAADVVADDVNVPQPKPAQWQQAKATYAPAANDAAGIDVSPSRFGSVGAAAASVKGRLGSASPELQADIESHMAEAKQKFGSDWENKIHWDAIDRQLNADSLPVPGRLTKGQAQQNGPLISEEWNKRSTNGHGPFFDWQNENQIANLKAIREQSTPDVYGNTSFDHGSNLIEHYQRLHDAEKGAVDAKWDKIRATASDSLIFDASRIMTDAQNALKAKKLTAYDPGGQLKELMDDVQRGGMSADAFVAWRQNLGREAMKGGNEGAAASAIIDAAEKAPLKPEAAAYRDMVSDALRSGRALHAKIKNDPAYQAVVEGRASGKDFVNKFIVNGKPEKFAQMVHNIGGDEVPLQTIRAAIMDRLRESAALDEQYQGNFASKSFNKHLDAITPSARLVFQDGELERLRSLADYSKHISATPRSSYRNFSNTATELQTPSHALVSKAGSMAVTGLEGALAAKTGGASVPVTTAIRAGIARHAERKKALQERQRSEEALLDSTRPSAGMFMD